MPTIAKITVVVAVFNAAATLERCLDSIAAQTWPHTELIVMDGGSTDGSRELLERAAAKIACWESQPDRGIYHAWNKALARASGDWICFLGADDFFWAPDVLERLAPHLPADVSHAGPAEARIVYGQVAIVSESGAVLRTEGRAWEEARAAFCSVMSIPHPGLLHHRSVFAEHGGFDESFCIAADYDLLLRELPHRPARFVPDVVTVGVQRGGVSYAPGTMPRMLDELARVRRKHGLRAPAPWRMTSVERKMRLAALLGRVLGDRRTRRLTSDVRRLTDGVRRLAGRPQ